MTKRVKINEHLDVTDYNGSHREGLAAEDLYYSFLDRLKYSLGKDKYTTTKTDALNAFSFAVRDRLTARYIKTQQTYHKEDAKRVYYLSMEFLIGRTLGNSIINLGIYNECAETLKQLGYDLEQLRELEWDAGLGNGGLGRLAACYLDSMATLQIPSFGYGIRYEYGIFFQHLKNGWQHETPDNWLRYGNPWEIQRQEYIYPVRFGGTAHEYTDSYGVTRHDWINTEFVMAMAYDTPVPGYLNDTVNILRLWSAKSTRDFNLDYFNSGDYINAVQEKNNSEIISKVLYPNDNNMAGKELRLKQEYFFVSATLQDILRRFTEKHTNNFALFPKKAAIQLNDTHPALAIAELMRILMDEKRLPWEKAWDITENTFAFTNHTILPEALEKWSVDLMKKLLPRHLKIIYEINRRFLDKVWVTYPGDVEKLRQMSIIEEGAQKNVQMAKLALIGCHKINGVSELHSEILKQDTFANFYQMFPEKFTNITNGITQRRWLKLANPRLSALLDEAIGSNWETNLYALKDLEAFAEDASFLEKWRQVKAANKTDFARYAGRLTQVEINPDSLFDFQVKRIHEYKRQLLNVLHVIYLYNKLREDPKADFVPRTVFFAGKAAPGYHMAKLIIKLISNVSHVINNDPIAHGKLNVVFLPNYRVSLAQNIFPAAELSQQISTAGMEASGTGNMKFTLNGALTIGTLDGANIEIKEEVGKENIFIFGHTAESIKKLKQEGYNPLVYYHDNDNIRLVIDCIFKNMFSPSEQNVFQPIVEALLYQGDFYCHLADFEAYLTCQEEIEQVYLDQNAWNKMSVLNVARSGKFSSDRSVLQYCEEIWQAKRIPVKY